MDSYSNVVLDSRGNAQVGAMIYVYHAGTETLVADIFSDDGVTGEDNPFPVDDDGEFVFWAANGKYDVKVSNGGASQTKAGVVLFDPTSNDNVGFGIVQPDTKVHIWQGSAGAVVAAPDTIVTIENSGDAFVSFLTPAINKSGFIFGDVNDNDVAKLYFDNAANTLVFSYFDTDFLKINSAGNLSIGGTPSSTGFRILSLIEHTPPSSVAGNEIKIYSDRVAGGNSTLALYLGEAVSAIGTFTPSHKVKMMINGVEYWVQLQQV